jgi:predicted permease
MGSAFPEVRSALRSLLRDPRSTAASVATLAIGIGAVTAIFSVVHGVLLRRLPYPSPDRIVQVWQINDGAKNVQFSDPNFEDLRERNRSFAALAQYSSWVRSVSGTIEPVRVRVATVSRDFFDVLGVRPSLGRAFAGEELREGGPPSALVSYGFWQRGLGGTEDLSAANLSLSGRIYSIVGVLPRGFDFPAGSELWTPRELEPRLPSRTAHNWQAVARLEEGVSVERARADVSAIARELRAVLGEDTWMVDADVIPLHEQLVGKVRPALVVLLGAVSFLLLVACANVVNLLLARAASRQREVAVRAALGASRWQTVRSFLTESALLSLTGGSLAVLLSVVGVPLLLALDPGNLPRSGEVGVSLPVLVFALGLSVLVSLVLGLATALRSTRRGTSAHLRDRSGASSGARLRSGIVVAQVAITLVLLIGAGLLARSLFRLLGVDPGFRRGSALVVDLAHESPGGEAAKSSLGRLQVDLLERVRALPGVGRAGLVDRLPLATGSRNGMFLVQTSPDEVKSYEDFGRLMNDPKRAGMAEYRAASAGYFETMGIPLVSGRLFEERDAPDAPHVALVSESLVKEKWPGEDPIGKLIQFGNMDGDLRLLNVVGIVGDVRHQGLDAAAKPTIYTNARQRPPSDYSVVVDFAGGAEAVSASVRGIVRELAPDVPPRIRLLDDVLSASVADRRFQVVLLATFGFSALLLAVFGIYGVVSYGVTERTREMGLRMALGARPHDVLALVVGQGSRLVALGLALGVAMALVLTRLLKSFLFEVAATDPITFGALALVLAGIALAACYLPARKASRVDPMISLRYE